MELNPWVFVLITYGLTVVIAACVAFIVKVIAFLVQRKKATAKEGTGPENKGGDA